MQYRPRMTLIFAELKTEGDIDIFFNMANCLGLVRGSSAAGDGSTGNTTSGTITASVIPVSGTMSSKMERGMWAGMLVFQMAIGWVTLNI